MAATGDLHGNIEKLRDHLRRVHYDSALQVDALAAGEPAGFLPLLHFVLLRHSHAVARWLAERGYELSAKTDLRFVETVYRLARVELGYRHALTSKQFLSPGFAERKVLFVIDLLRLVQEKHAAMSLEREKSRKIAPGECADSVQRLTGRRPRRRRRRRSRRPPPRRARTTTTSTRRWSTRRRRRRARSARSVAAASRCRSALFATPPAAAAPPPPRRRRRPRRRGRRRRPQRRPGAARPGAEAHLLAEVTELRRLVLHACSQLAALQSSTDAATAQLSARMALLEGRVGLVEAGAAARPAMAAAPPPMASAEAVELVAKEAARPPLARLGADPLTAPRPTAATAANPVAAASLGGRTATCSQRGVHRRHQPPDEPRRRSGGSRRRKGGADGLLKPRRWPRDGGS